MYVPNKCVPKRQVAVVDSRNNEEVNDESHRSSSNNNKCKNSRPNVTKTQVERSFDPTYNSQETLVVPEMVNI